MSSSNLKLFLRDSRAERLQRQRLRKLRGLLSLLLLLAACYVSLAFVRYQFRHPDMTTTRVMLNWRAVLSWK